MDWFVKVCGNELAAMATKLQLDTSLKIGWSPIHFCIVFFLVLLQTSLLRTLLPRAFFWWWWWKRRHGIKSEGLRSNPGDVTRLGKKTKNKNKKNLFSFLPQLCPERKRRKQEKMVARQARREQLKRLHRAQVLPCCAISHSCTSGCVCLLSCVGSHLSVDLEEWSPLFTCGLLTVQAVQRQLEEVAEKQRDLEERGVAVEKSIRREAGTGEPYSQKKKD